VLMLRPELKNAEFSAVPKTKIQRAGPTRKPMKRVGVLAHIIKSLRKRVANFPAIQT
jgi:hypothetical protein